jgi:uncharacterized protein (TIGR02996 family)
VARTPKRFPGHGPDLRALLASCHADPDDDTPRLVLADWLDEHDDPRGELVRLQCRLAALPAGHPDYDPLFERHRRWWKNYRHVWSKEVSGWVWDFGPHDRGLPTVGHYGEYDFLIQSGDISDPTEVRDTTAEVIADGWPGMTWVFAEDPTMKSIRRCARPRPKSSPSSRSPGRRGRSPRRRSGSACPTRSSSPRRS